MSLLLLFGGAGGTPSIPGTARLGLGGAARATSGARVAAGSGRASLGIRTRGLSSSALTLPVAQITVDATLMVLAVPTAATATPAGESPQFELRAVENDGTVRATFPRVVVHSHRQRLGEPDELQFSIPISDGPKLLIADADQTPYREVQLWRNGQLRAWCIPTKRRAESRTGMWRYTARGVEWPISKRFVGQASRFSFVRNGGAESGTTYWSTAYAPAAPDVFTTSASRYLTDGVAFRLNNSSSGGGLDSYAAQRRTVTATGVGLTLYMVAWFYIDSTLLSGGADDPFDRRLFTLARRSGSTVKEWAAFRRDERTPLDQWVRGQIRVDMPPNAIETVDVRLYAPYYDIYFDAVTVTCEESVSCINENSPSGTGWDQVEIAHEVVRYAQGKGKFAFWQGRHNGKSDLNIGVGGAPSGIVRERTYQAYDHQKVWTASPRGSGVLDEWPTREDGFDQSVVLTSTTRTWTTHYPRQGSAKSLVLWHGADAAANVVEWDVQEDLERCANDVVILGSFGQGAGREEGGYTNASSLGGLTMEAVESAPTGTPVDALDAIANARGLQHEQVIAAIVLTIPAELRHPETGVTTSIMVGTLGIGDVHRVRIDDLGLDESRRIVEIDHNLETDTLRVVVNREVEVG